MACKNETREINGKKCFTRQWPASKAMKAKAELIKVGGVNILPFVEGRADLRALVALEKAAQAEDLVALIKDFVCSVRVDGVEVRPETFDTVYCGELWEVIEVFAFACEVQYKDFFEQGFRKLTDLASLS